MPEPGLLLFTLPELGRTRLRLEVGRPSLEKIKLINTKLDIHYEGKRWSEK